MNKELICVFCTKFQDKNGNTYHSGIIHTPTETIKINYTYGYGNQYQATANEILLKKGYVLQNYRIKYTDIITNLKKNML